MMGRNEMNMNGPPTPSVHPTSYSGSLATKARKLHRIRGSPNLNAHKNVGKK